MTVRTLMEPTRDRREHEWVTLSDLALLVAGIALVLVLPHIQSYWPHRTDFLGPWPAWFPWFFCIRQLLGAASMALAPVVLGRCVRYRRFAFPAEFLVLCAAAPSFAEAGETGLIRWSYFRRSGLTLQGPGLDGMSTAFTNNWIDSTHWTVNWVLFIVGVIALASFFVGRRRMSPWVLTLLLVVAWYTAYDVCSELAAHYLPPLVPKLMGRRLRQTEVASLYALLRDLPRFLCVGIPAVMALNDVRARNKQTTWVAWTALALCAALWIESALTELGRGYWISSGDNSWRIETLARTTALAIAAVISVIAGTLLPWAHARTVNDDDATLVTP
jgi:hypothetical protein